MHPGELRLQRGIRLGGLAAPTAELAAGRDGPGHPALGRNHAGAHIENRTDAPPRIAADAMAATNMAP